ncbi:ArnT family glycosyltransferase [Terriglobus tenax]|uniref:ArnT family glycosyltransferase n=1 Tax=Terriglobus tenax TaxID=1111115 RepID=UPI0021DFBF1F|nr:glycosyltransferase family 39 protein [Terriglobus tenax]
MAVSVTVRPTNPALSQALRLAAVFALIKLALHVATNLLEPRLGYGYFRDEFYYLMCGRHLAWGYVDHGPVVAVQARLSEMLFGHSLAGLRMFSALAGAGRVFLTGLLAWALGGRRPALGLAMLCVLCAPQYLGTDSFLSMNSFESLFWMTCLLVLVLLQDDRIEPGRAWVIFGVSAGMGLLNKPSMTFFLVALGVALLCTPQRKLLFTRHAALGIALLVLIASPNLLWQVNHHWPTLEFLSNGRKEGKNVALGPIAFFLTQVKNMNPLTAFVWVPGLVFLLRRAPWQWLGLTWVFTYGIMFTLHAKDYYFSPIYPLVFAAGGLAWETRFADRKSVYWDHALAFPVASAMIVLLAIFSLPMAIPVLPVDAWVRYTTATHLRDNVTNTEKDETGVFPQFFADRFGWEELSTKVKDVYNSLSPADRSKVVVLASNYGEAGSLIFLNKPGELPPVVSGHNNHYLWGPQGATGEVVIAINGAKLPEMLKYYESCTATGHLDQPYAMPYESHRTIYLCRNRKKNMTSDWADFKHYI